MQNNDFDSVQTGDELTAFARRLGQVSLEARVDQRDRVAFECGRAAATVPSTRHQAVRPSWMSMAACTLVAFASGALLGGQSITPAGQTRKTTIMVQSDGNPSTVPEDSDAISPGTQEWSQSFLTRRSDVDVQLGSVLRSGSAVSKVGTILDGFVSSSETRESVSPSDPSQPIRAGQWNRLLNFNPAPKS